MHDQKLLVICARQLIQGMVTSFSNSGASPVPRLGVCIVERCARAIEAACSGCQKLGCQRCTIAAELRSAEGRINSARDAELEELRTDEENLGEVIDKMIQDLCEDHLVFGAVLAEQWYSRRNFLASSMSNVS